MSVDRAIHPAGLAPPATAGPAPLGHRAGRWIDNWDAEDAEQWNGPGKAIAKRNLQWSIACEFLGFVVWQLWSIVVVYLPAAGFTFTTPQIFWLISMPSLVGATLRIPYTFMVPRFGGRNWTVISALLLLVPSIGLALCVANPDTPFGVMLAVAALAGFGGGNFASSMANITFFYPAREKGWALGLNAAGGNLGAAVAQLVVPLVVALTAAVTLGLPLAGWIWVPLILAAAFGAWKYMDNLSNAKSDIAGSLAALKEPHLWIMSVLYIGTFGSFIGFAGVFPKLIVDVFPTFSTLDMAGATLSLAFLGPLVGSLARPFGGRLADRCGGAFITVCAFAVMGAAALAEVWTLPLANFWLFLALFLALFAAAGAGNGATYRMIPMIFARRGAAERISTGQPGTGQPGTGTVLTSAGPVRDSVSTARKSAAALGLISAIGAYGGFVIPQVLNASASASGSYDYAFYGFVAAYALMLGLTWFCYLRRSSAMREV
ncbi:MFS transporter [Arthrobacter sp. Br18]|uniref:MFS transporter n=1 Tax=Arthrobacter sp. Br18 TaxID=1312954 RepID=UPI00047D85F1|nr:MFS transporter [Arthrobacter sp. Br18]